MKTEQIYKGNKEEQWKEEQPKYNPITCDHKIPSGKYEGFSAYSLLSHGSGGGPGNGYEENVSVCLRCGTIKASGKTLVNDKWEHYHTEFSIDLPDAVAAIVKNCNWMNKQIEGYVPFIHPSPKEEQTELERFKNRLLVEFEEKLTYPMSNQNEKACAITERIYKEFKKQ